MDYVQALFSFFIAPLFGTVILGMLWKRATNAGGFWGLLVGTASSIGMFVYTTFGGLGGALAHRALDRRTAHGRDPLPRPLELDHLRRRHRRRQLHDQAKPEAELAGLVYGATPFPTTAQPASGRSRSSGPSSSSSSSSS